jgi:hypothetical protein
VEQSFADIVLQTNLGNPYLAFREVVRFGDASGYGAILTVRSGWISADYSFVFQTQPLLQFIAQLEQMDRDLIGVARLKPLWENQFVEFQVIRSGQVLVRGDLMDYGGMEQRLQFAFCTDQTCLRPLIDAFRQIVA